MVIDLINGSIRPDPKGNYILDSLAGVMYNGSMENTANTDPNVVENHCVECNEYESECECAGALPRCGFVTLPTQKMAEQYLIGLPDGYSGSTRKMDSGWAVSFRRMDGRSS